MSEEKVSEAKDAVVSILEVLGVEKVVFVDDANSDGIEVEEVIAAASELQPKAIVELFPEIGPVSSVDDEMLSAKIREKWGELDEATRNTRGEALLVEARGAEHGRPNDTADRVILESLIEEELLVSLSPRQWDEQHKDLLEQGEDNRTLFLFDRDFSGAGGDPDGGMKIIESLLSGQHAEHVICGLLTHTVSPQSQPEEWKRLSNAHSVSRDRFIVIPKSFLGEQPLLFAEALKFVALCPEFTRLKSETKKIIENAAQAAADRVEGVSIHDLDHMVFRVSAEEGLWEPDMLFRLHALFHRLEARKLAFGGELEAIASKLRVLSGLPTKSESSPVPANARLIQHDEMYEPQSYLNENHLPIEVGDIFEKVGVQSKKKYVLLGQPCDLMVRGDGKRYPELGRVQLVELVPGEANDEFSVDVPFFDTEDSKDWRVKLKAVHFVRMPILDLCAYNRDGIARWSSAGSPPAGVRPSLAARYGHISKLCRSKGRLAEQLVVNKSDTAGEKVAKQKLKKVLGSSIFDDDLFKGEWTSDGSATEVVYNCRRVYRLCRERAIGLLMAFSSAQARPAYDRPFV